MPFIHAPRGAVALALPLLISCLFGSDSQLTGRIVDESGLVISGAKVTLSGGPISGNLIATSTAAGLFHLAQVPPGRYQLKVEKPGFYAFVSANLDISAESVPIEVVLNHSQEYEETVNVVYSAPVIDRQEAAAQTTLTSEEILDLPSSTGHDVRKALPMVPGIVRDRAGRYHLNGGGDDQAFYSLDGFNITGPVSGTLDNRISVDAVRFINVSTSRYSAEFGKGSAGVLAMETARGDDKFRVSATNFVPSVAIHEGPVLKSWNPRASFSGPIVKGRAWYYNALDLQYDLNIVDELPANANRNRNWYGSNLSRLQVNLTRRNILTLGLLFNFRNSLNLGLSPLDPVETTRNRHERFYFFNVKDQAYLSSGWVLEGGFAVNQVNTREIPQGDQIYRITPRGRTGNYFQRSQGRAERIEVLANALTPQWTWYGRHSLKLGVVGDVIHYHQDSNRRSYEVWRQSGSRSRLVEFLGNPTFSRDSSEVSGFIQDRWFPAESLLVEAGIRFDWDQVMRKTLKSPRLALTWGPPGPSESKFSAGIGVYHDPINMDLLTRDLDQQRVDTFFAGDGTTIRSGPVLSKFMVNDRGLRPPVYVNWSLGWERKLPWEFYLRANYIWKHGRQGWSYDLLPGVDPAVNVYQLEGIRRDRNSYVELTLTRRFKGKYDWLLSYARSSARSSAVVDFSLDNPMLGRQGSGPLDWDNPNRMISWAAFPAPHFPKYLLSYFVEWHTGFPYSVVNESEQLVGEPNTRRFPEYFSLNLYAERRFRFWRSEWAFRIGASNVLGRQNPTVVTNNIDAPDFGRFSGTQGRLFLGRIRFLGRL